MKRYISSTGYNSNDSTSRVVLRKITPEDVVGLSTKECDALARLSIFDAYDDLKRITNDLKFFQQKKRLGTTIIRDHISNLMDRVENILFLYKAGAIKKMHGDEVSIDDPTATKEKTCGKGNVGRPKKGKKHKTKSGKQTSVSPRKVSIY